MVAEIVCVGVESAFNASPPQRGMKHDSAVGALEEVATAGLKGTCPRRVMLASKAETVEDWKTGVFVLDWWCQPQLLSSTVTEPLQPWQC